MVVKLSEYNLVGVVFPFSGSNIPSGWLLCDGSALSRTGTYSALFNVIDTFYGAGDNSTTFNLPNFKGRLLVGKDNMGGIAASTVTLGGSGLDGSALGKTGGVTSVILTASQCGVPSHNHSITDPGHIHSLSYLDTTSDLTGLTNTNLTGTNSSLNVSLAYTGITVNNSTDINASTSHQNVQPSIIMNYIIKY